MFRKVKKKRSSDTLAGDQTSAGCPMNAKLLYQWKEMLASHLPSLNGWQVENVGLFSYGVVLAESCQQQQIARRVACGETVESSARRLRRFLDNEALCLSALFVEWTRWVVEAMEGERVILMVDETKLNETVAAMVVGMAYEGRCIPLAWRCYSANDAASYPAEGQVGMIAQLLQGLRPAMPVDKTVVVLADRGIGTSPELCRQVERLGWKYLFRVTRQTKLVTETEEYTIAAMVQPGETWAASGRIFKKRGRLPAHARALWQVGYEQPWALVTNAPELTGAEYAQRNWQEQSFRDLKSHGWQWDESQIYLPEHMARLLLLLSLAYGWMLALGSHAVQHSQTFPLSRHPDGRPRRHWSLFKEGLRVFAENVQRHTVCLEWAFLPDKRFT